MHFSHRTQNAAANTPRRARQAAIQPSGAGFDTQNREPMSAARLAAEAAFAGPPFDVHQNVQAQISVRRTRVLALADLPAAQTAAPSPATVPKGPRVFRVDAAPALPAAQAEPITPAGPGGVLPGPAAGSRARQRLAVDKRPGPVVLVVNRPPAQPAPPAAVTLPKFQALAARLADVTAILAEIETAQSFWFMDPGFETQYQRLRAQDGELLGPLKPVQGKHRSDRTPGAAGD